MKLVVLGSGSDGNGYLLVDENEILVVDCGFSFNEVKKAINFEVEKIVGVVATHIHSDHDGYTNQFENAGIPVFRPFAENNKSRAVRYGGFTIDSFPLVHDVPCYGFLISHKSFGKLVYATDTEYIKYMFNGVNHFLIEANYDDEITDVEDVVANHIYRGHMSINTAMEFLKKNVTDETKTITLCHLSSKNADAMKFIDRVVGEFGKRCYIAHRNMKINLEK